MRKIILYAVFYAIVHMSSGDFAARYEGMSQATVENLIDTTYHCDYDLVDKATYDAFITAHAPTGGH